MAITRPSTAEWIDALKMRGLPGSYANQRLDWIPGSRNLVWDRTVTGVDARTKSDHGGRADYDGTRTTVRRRYGGAGDVGSADGASGD